MDNTPVKSSTPAKSPNKARTPHTVKSPHIALSSHKKHSPYKSALKAKVSRVSPSTNIKLRCLRNIRDILLNQRSELEKGSFIEHANIFQTWLYDLVEKVTHDKPNVKERISLLPGLTTDASYPVEKKLIDTIERLRAEIYFLKLEKKPEEINKAYVFLAETKEELQKLGDIADEKNKCLEEIKEKQNTLLRENEIRIKGEVKKATEESKDKKDIAPPPQLRRPMLFNATDLLGALGKVGKKQTMAAAIETPRKKLDHKDQLAEGATKRVILNSYHGNKVMGIPVDEQLKFAIDQLLASYNIQIDAALDNEELKIKIFSLYEEHTRNKTEKESTSSKVTVQAIDTDAQQLNDSYDFLAQRGIVFDPNPKEEVMGLIREHLNKQIEKITEETIRSRQKIQAFLSKVDKDIKDEQDKLEITKKVLEEERIARDATGGLPLKIDESQAQEIKAELEAKLKKEMEAKFKEMMDGFKAVLGTSTTDLPKAAIDFLSLNGFDSDPENINNCTSNRDGIKRHTPLTLAALKVNEDACKALISGGASVNAVNGVGNTPLHMLSFLSAEKPDVRIDKAIRLIEYFVEKGADLSIKNKEGKTPCDTALNAEISAKLKLCLDTQSKPREAKPSATVLAERAFTPLYSSPKPAKHLSQATIDFLKANEFSIDPEKINMYTSTKEGIKRYTPLTLAALKINEEVCKDLINYGASVNAANGIGNTPLHMLSFFNPEISDIPIAKVIGMIEYFLEKGADLSIKNNEGKTPWETALNPEIVAKLKPRIGVQNTL